MVVIKLDNVILTLVLAVSPCVITPVLNADMILAPAVVNCGKCKSNIFNTSLITFVKDVIINGFELFTLSTILLNKLVNEDITPLVPF